MLAERTLLEGALAPHDFDDVFTDLGDVDVEETTTSEGEGPELVEVLVQLAVEAEGGRHQILGSFKRRTGFRPRIPPELRFTSGELARPV